jgi:hypothetical protein
MMNAAGIHAVVAAQQMTELGGVEDRAGSDHTLGTGRRPPRIWLPVS